jgi:hypothetical protein
MRVERLYGAGARTVVASLEPILLLVRQLGQA